jgi:L-rhamnose mutarotase
MLYIMTPLTYFVGDCYKRYKAFAAYFQHDGYASYHTDHYGIFIFGKDIRIFDLYWMKNVKNIRAAYDDIINRWAEIMRHIQDLERAVRHVEQCRRKLSALLSKMHY